MFVDQFAFCGCIVWIMLLNALQSIDDHECIDAVVDVVFDEEGRDRCDVV